MSKLFDEKTEKKICKEYRKGKNYSQLAKEYERAIRTIKNILIRCNEKLRITRYSCDESAFSKYTSESVYWAEFINGDGNIGIKKEANKVGIQLKLTDIETLERLKRFLKSNHPIHTGRQYKPKSNKFTYYCIIQIYSQKIVQDLANNFNIYPQKTKKEKWFHCPDKLLNHAVRGLFDADGGWYIHPTINKLEFGIAGNKKLLLQIQKILMDEIGLNKTVLKENEGCWELKYNGNKQCMKIGDWLYKNSTTKTRMSRKYDKFQAHKKWYEDKQKGLI